MRPASRALLVLCALFGSAGCALPGPWRRAVFRPACPGPLAPAEAVPEGFRASGTYRVRRDGREVALRVALEKRDGRLVVVALTPVGAEAFTAVQAEGEGADPTPEIEAPLGPWVGAAPLDVLRDLHRAHFPRALADDAGVRVERDRVDGRRRVRIHNPACGSEAVFVEGVAS